MGLTQDLCTIIHATRYETLGDECVHRIKQAIKDGVAVALAGMSATPVRIMTEHFLALGGTAQASIWGTPTKVSLTQASYVNAVATHVLDFEPMWSPPTHAVSPTVPVAFALAESKGLTGKQIVTAVAKGLEIQGRLQYAGDQFVPEQLKFHPPGVAGVFGSAIVAAEMLGFDVLTMQHALGISASRAGALLANVGSMTKATHCGNAAASGLDAALLAERGFTGNPNVFEAHKGVIEAFYSGHFDAERLLAYGKPFRVVDPGLAIKLFPSQFGTHYGITAALEVQRAVRDAARISRVKVITPVMKYVDRQFPGTGLDGKFSLQYTVAAGLLDGFVKIDTFTDERRFRPDMAAMLEKIDLVQDPSIPGDFHGMRIEVHAELVDGSMQSAICRGPRGSWGVPMTDDDHRAKLQDCFVRVLAPDRSQQLLALLDRVEALSADEMKTVITLMAP